MLRSRRRRLHRRREAKELRVKGHTYKQGDWISLDGTTGRVIAAQLKTLPAQPDDPDLVKFMSWVDPLRKLQHPRQRRHSSRCQAGAVVRRRRHRPLPHRAHVLCRRSHRTHAHHDSGEQREGPPRRAQEAAAHAARRFRRPLQGDGIAAGDHPPARSAAARVPAQARRSAGRDRSTSKRPSLARRS